MLKTILTTVSCSLLLFLTACNSTPTAPENKAGSPGTPTATPRPDINYGAGFSPMESTPDGTSWRWMAETGSIELKNTRTDMRLKLAGDVPVNSMTPPVQYTVKFNGETLDQFTATKENTHLEKEFAIPAAKQSNGEFSELTIQSDKYFVPKLVDKKSTDERKLSFSLRKLEWAAK
jgi:hypothetical protein